MRDWDSYQAYLFDIDGTLLCCKDAVHYRGFCEVLSEIAGCATNLDGVTAHGNVDLGIIRDALVLRGISETLWRPRLKELQEKLASYVERHHFDFQIDVLPGVIALLEHLHARGAIIGVATGNLERIGWAKIEHCGLRHRFVFGGFSDDCERRHDVVHRAVRKARQICGPHAAICLVGDTPADVRAARSNGVDVIAVASGIYSCTTLAQEHPDRLVASLQELIPSITKPS